MVYKDLGDKPLPLELIRASEETQMRVEICEETVDRYLKLWEETEDAWPFEEKCVVFLSHDGSFYWLADGFHRYISSQRASRASVQCEVYEGGIEAAQDYALSANSKHGLPRSNKDKRKAVNIALSLDRWSSQSNYSIASHVGVSESLVRKVRDEISNPSAFKTHEETEGTEETDSEDLGNHESENIDENSLKETNASEQDYSDADDPFKADGEYEEDFELAEGTGVEEDSEELELPEHLEPIRDALIDHFGSNELPTKESHYTAIGRLGAEAAVDVVETARESMEGETPTLNEYREAAKSLDSKYAKSLLSQHLEAAMRSTDDYNRIKNDPAKHKAVMDLVQQAWETLKDWT